jgi:hypothetical protein
MRSAAVVAWFAASQKTIIMTSDLTPSLSIF